MKAYKMSNARLLSEPMKMKRKDKANFFVERLTDDTQPPVLWTDEKLFPVQAIENPQNDRIYGRNKEEISVESRLLFRRQKPAQLWWGVTSTGLKTPLIFIDEEVKFNQPMYLRMLQEKLISWVQENIKKNWNNSSTEWCHFTHR